MLLSVSLLKADVAQEQIRQDAITVGLLDTAENNVEKVLKEFFKNIDYTVNVTFKSACPCYFGPALMGY